MFVFIYFLVHFTHTHTHTQLFYGSMDFVWDNPGELVPEETFTNLHLSWSSIVPYLLWSMASSLFNPRTWQSISTIFLQVFFGLPLGLLPSTSYSIQPLTSELSLLTVTDIVRHCLDFTLAHLSDKLHSCIEASQWRLTCHVASWCIIGSVRYENYSADGTGCKGHPTPTWYLVGHPPENGCLLEVTPIITPPNADNTDVELSLHCSLQDFWDVERRCNDSCYY